VMDFEPGQYLYVKEIHYNQHGLLLLQGQGIYRLGNSWCVSVCLGELQLQRAACRCMPRQCRMKQHHAGRGSL
jgi:glyoxylate utilization-related uncharacterized protein